MGYYDTAQVCLNGHVITSMAGSSPELRKEYCPKCGSKTIMKCQNCASEIPGHYHVKGVIDFGGTFTPPAYCHKCGKPFPWTEENLKAARELIDLSNIDESEKQAIKDDLPSLLSDTPRTKVAATKMSIFLSKAGREVGSAMRDILVNIASEAAKKLLFP